MLPLFRILLWQSEQKLDSWQRLAALRIILRLYRVDGDKIGPMRRGHGLPCSRQALPQIGLDIPALVAVETERLLMAIGAIVSRLLRQQSVFLDEKGAMIARYAGSAMAVPAFLERALLYSLWSVLAYDRQTTTRRKAVDITIILNAFLFIMISLTKFNS